MFRNYLLVAIRALLRQKGYTLINVIGLAIGTCCFIFVALLVDDELSYDRFHEHADRIYRLTLDARVGDKEFLTARSSAAVAQTLKAEVPGVEAAARFRVLGDHAVRYGDRSFNEYKLYLADSTLIDVFSFSFVEGGRSAFLTRPGMVVISEPTARKYFGGASALGKVLLVDGATPYQVSAVVKAFPRRSHWRFDFLISSVSTPFQGEDPWISNNWYTYVLLKEGASARQAEQTLQGIVTERVRPVIQQNLGGDWSAMEARGMYYRYRFQPLEDIHLHSHLDEEVEPTGSITVVWMFIAIGALILLIACINFINLSTARSARRAKEVGVRKVLGSQRTQLIQLFMTEAVLVTAAAMVVSVALVEVILPTFNAYIGKELSTGGLGIPAAAGGLGMLTILVSLFAGSYPAFVLSSFQPATVLKGKVRSGMHSGKLRRALVVGQFAISIMMMVGTIVVYRQLQYVNAQDLGFTKERMYVVDNTWLLGPRAMSFRERMLAKPAVAGAAFTQNLPGYDIGSGAYRAEGNDRSSLMMIRQLFADFEYLQVIGVKLKEGRYLSRLFTSDSSDAVLINEAAARLLGYDHPVGRKVIGYFANRERPLQIVGVTEDFHYEPLHQPILPTIILLSRGYPTRLVLQLQGNLQEAVADVQREWNACSGGQPFTGYFLDKQLEGYYRRDEAVGTLFGILASLGFFVSCLGLLGLAMFATEQRRKELGIRKVFGASRASLTGLLTKEFVALVLVANLIAWPLAYMAMQRWLEAFAYRISLELWMFCLAGALALLVAIVAVGYHTLKAAAENPIESLRYE